MGMRIASSAQAMGTNYTPAASASAPAPAPSSTPALSSTATWQLAKLAATLPKPPAATETSGNNVNVYA